MKRITQALALAICTSAGLAHAADEIKVRTLGISEAGGTIRVLGTVRVKNIATQKQVQLEVDSGLSSRVIPLTYAGSAGDGFENWRADGIGCLGSACGTNVRVRAVMLVNNTTFIDDNNGSRYIHGKNAGWTLTDPAVIAISDPVLNTRLGIAWESQYGRISGQIATKVGATPSVTVGYTIDGTTWKETTATSLPSQKMGDVLTGIANPNSSGVQQWEYTLDMEGKSWIKYWVRYRVNGQEIFDNNFGQNYTFKFPTNYTKMRIRQKTGGWRPENMELVGNVWRSWVDNGLGDNEFKFDVNSDWATNFGDNAPLDRIVDLGGANIPIAKGSYEVRFDDRTGAYRAVCSNTTCGDIQPRDNRKTVIFIKKQTVSGQDMFARGGLDYGYVKNTLGRGDCSKTPSLCGIYINHQLFINDVNRLNDLQLDWLGLEPGQQAHIKGSPLVWTTNNTSNSNKVSVNGYGYTDWNRWGDHYWLFYVNMDCANGIPGVGGSKWFEFKAFLTNYNVNGGWEGDIQSHNIRTPAAYGASTGPSITPPYASKNHMGQCGKVNVFEWESGNTLIYNAPPSTNP